MTLDQLDLQLVRECLRGSMSFEARRRLRGVWNAAYLAAACHPDTFGLLTDDHLCEIATRAAAEAFEADYGPIAPREIP